MPKPTKGPRLGGSSSHKKALLANRATSLFEHGRIKTTEPKARALRPYAEKLITPAKKGTRHNRREVLKKIRDTAVAHKGDTAPMAVIELVQEKTVTSEAERARRSGASKAAAKKAAPKPAAEAEEGAAEAEPATAEAAATQA